MPPEKKNVDPRSLIIGFLIAVVVLLLIALANAKQDKEDETTVAPIQPAPTGYIALFQQEQMAARTLERRIQSMLDKLIGIDRSVIRIRVSLDSNGTLKHQRIALSIDKTKVVFDATMAHYIEEERSQEEIHQLASLTEEAAGLDGSRGDMITVFAVNFDKTQEIQEIQAMEEAKHQKRNGLLILAALLATATAVTFFLYRYARRHPESGLATFFSSPANKVALMLAAGLVLCTGALGLWSHLPKALAAGFGIFLLLVGLYQGRDLLEEKSPQANVEKLPSN